MVIYYDGSFRWHLDGKEFPPNQKLVSWGIVVADGDDNTELSGWRNASTHLRGCHELIAFIEAALYASSHGAHPEDCTFIGDDEVTAYGSQARNAGWYFDGFGSALDTFLQKLRDSKFYPEEVLQVAERFLNLSRFHKVKGHSTTVYNLRCDYLANFEFRQHYFGDATKSSFQSWASHGFSRRLGGVDLAWHPPFLD